jgi:hypothetical protein
VSPVCYRPGGTRQIARSLHYSSARSSGPFIPVNCGALPDNLFESEIFGYEKGAFTDARRGPPRHCLPLTNILRITVCKTRTYQGRGATARRRRRAAIKVFLFSLQ